MSNFDEGVDLSGYTKPAQKSTVTQKPSPLQELPVRKGSSMRTMVLVTLALLLAIAQIVLVVLMKQDSTPPLPDGYRIVTPPGQPPKMEPIK